MCFLQLWEALLPSVQLSAQLEEELLCLLLLLLFLLSLQQCLAHSRHQEMFAKQLLLLQLLTLNWPDPEPARSG